MLLTKEEIRGGRKSKGSKHLSPREMIRPDKVPELMTSIRYHPFLANNSGKR